MAEDHGRESGGGGIQIDLVEDVQHVDPVAGDLDRGRRRQRLGPSSVIGVAAHGRHRRDASERLEHVGPTDVAGMEDALHPGQRVQRLGTQQAVRVGDQPHPRHSAHSRPRAAKNSEQAATSRTIR